jgi:hypothetical protein
MEITMKKRNILIATGVLILALAIGFGAAFAWAENAPAAAASPIHPTFALLDADGVHVLESRQPVSTMQTCGQCHDVEFIASHAYHSDLGLSNYNVNAETWNASNGLFGKFDPLTYRYLSQTGDERTDLTTPDWINIYGWRVPGGGPAATSRGGQPLVSLKPNASDPEASTYNPETGKYEAWNWAKSGVIEMNCFLCHSADPNNTARLASIERGEFGWANTATLLGTGIVLRTTTEGFTTTKPLIPMATCK